MLNAQVSDLAHGAAAQDRVCTARASQLFLPMVPEPLLHFSFVFFSQILEPDCAGVGNVKDLSLLNYWGNLLSIQTEDFILIFVTSEPI